MENRKVGGVVIMHPNHNNYGTALQGLATTIIIQKLGYPFRIIRYNKTRSICEILKLIPDLIRTGILGAVKDRFKKKFKLRSDAEYGKNIAMRTSVCNKFKEQYLEPLCDYYNGWENLCKGSLNYDIVFVGSDQVWTPMSLYAGFYNLEFVDRSVPRFSYSSSFGRSTVMPHQVEGVRSFLNKMDVIAVRESSGAKIVKDLTGRDALVVVDPTLLLTAGDWKEIIKDSEASITEPYILCYMLGPRRDNRESVNKIGKALGLKVVTFNHMDRYVDADKNFGDINKYDCNCLDFLKLLANAEYVVTDSFHCSVFSILFHKKFLSFYRINPTDANSTHSRIDNLLDSVGLRDRIATNNNDVKSLIESLVAESDWETIDSRIATLRDESLSFLSNALKVSK